MKVISKGSSEEFADQPLDLEKIRSRLGIDRAVAGVLRREGETAVLEVSLLAADGSSSPWTRRYRFEPERQFRLENEIVLDLAEALAVPVGSEVVRRFGLREPTSEEAFRYFRWGQSFQEKYRESWSEEDFAAALKNYEEAVSLDPGYALAFWGMGNLYEARYVRTSEAKDLILMLNNYEAAFRANPRLAEPYLGRGWAFFYEQKFDRAHENFRNALRIDPKNPDVQLNAGSFLRSLGLFREAVKFYEEAVRLDLDPLNTMPYRLMAVCYGSLGETDRAIEVLHRALSLEPASSGIRLDLARIRLLRNEVEEAERQIEAAERLSAGQSAPARVRIWLYAAQGRREEALRLMSGLDLGFRYEATNAYCLLNMDDEAVRNIRLGIERGFRDVKEFLYTYAYLAGNPLFRNLVSRPDFAAVLEEQKKTDRERRDKFGGLR